jgi:hypothetical protein
MAAPPTLEKKPIKFSNLLRELQLLSMMFMSCELM